VALAERQRGVVHRAQLLALGISGSSISRWEAADRLHRLYPSVYALGHRALDDEGRLRAALLYSGPGSALSHLTAAWWWQLLESKLRVIHLSAETAVASVRAVLVHHPSIVERTEHRGLPITTVPRTLLDIAPMVPFDRLRRALAEAEFLGLASIDEIADALGRGRRGSRALRKALASHRPELARTLSALEERFLSLCERHGIPLPEVNVRVNGFMVDALWRDEKVVVELDGRTAHGSAAAIERDHGRDLTLRLAGYDPVRYTWRQVTREARAVAADLRNALGLN